MHQIGGSPFDNQFEDADWIRTARVFTFVRNPYTRIVSAYLNKIQQQEPGIWRLFTKKYGLDPDREISFRRFLEVITADSAYDLDPHWRPQYVNILFPYVRPNFIGRLENMDQELPYALSTFLNASGAQVVQGTQHKTGAAEKALDFFEDPSTRRMFVEMFEPDFHHFGYSQDLQNAIPLDAGLQIAENSHDELADLVQFFGSSDWAEKRALKDRISGYEQSAQDVMISDWLKGTRQAS